MELTKELSEEYITLWKTCTINSSYQKELDWYVNAIQNNQRNYVTTQAEK
jgi:lysozyme family protein